MCSGETSGQSLSVCSKEISGQSLCVCRVTDEAGCGSVADRVGVGGDTDGVTGGGDDDNSELTEIAEAYTTTNATGCINK